MLPDLKRTFTKSIIYSIGNFSAKIIGLILIPIYTTKLTTADYGMLGILEVTSELLIAVFGFSLYAAFIRLYWDEEYKIHQKSMFFTSLFYMIFVACLMFAGFYPFLAHLSKLLLGSPDYQLIVKLMLISVGLRIINQIPSTLLRIKEKALLFTMANIGKLFVVLVSTIYLIVYQNHKVEAIFEAQIIGQCFYLLFLLKFIISNLVIKFNIMILRSMLSYSTPLIFSSISGILLTIGDRYCLRFLAEFSELGIYNLAHKFSNVIKLFFISSIQLALPPIVFKMVNKPNSKRFYSKIMTYTTLIIIFFSVSLSIFAGEVIRFLVKNQNYWEAHKIIPILSFSMVFLVLINVSGIGLSIVKKTKIRALIVVLTAVINIGLNIIFIQMFSILGAALATLISRILEFIAIYRYSQKEYRIPYELKKVILLILTGIVIYLLSILSNDLTIYLRILIKTVLLISIPFILYILKFYEDIELLRLKQSWQKWRNPRNWIKR